MRGLYCHTRSQRRAHHITTQSMCHHPHSRIISPRIHASSSPSSLTSSVCPYRSSRHARQNRPVAPSQREHSVLPTHSACALRRLQRGQSSSPQSFFWRQKWQVMPGVVGRCESIGWLVCNCRVKQVVKGARAPSPPTAATTHRCGCHTSSRAPRCCSAAPGTAPASSAPRWRRRCLRLACMIR
jgi:hypothetical protein